LTTFLLVRHASGDHVGRRLAGRAPGAPLNDAGREEAARLASWLAPVPLAAVYSSPLERARDTAASVAAPHGLPVTVDEAFTELDFGGWTGRSVESLAGDALWGPVQPVPQHHAPHPAASSCWRRRRER
jgi:probable phosphoglycerate mutase